MSGKNHTGETKVIFNLDKKLAAELDEMLLDYGYNNRSEYLRSQIIVDVQDYKKSKK
jgi:metal-responsive CopG/Arc/MetJ family transcriptional regulator